MKIITCAVVILLTCISPIFSNSENYVKPDVQRYSVDLNKGEPHIGKALFRNDNQLCFFSYCWNRRGNCGGKYSCCWCECKDRGAFFSKSAGCYSASQMKEVTANKGESCMFYTLKLKFRYVPLFKDPQAVTDIGIGLPPTEIPFTIDINTTCKTGMIYYYDYYGTKLLLYNNKCNEMFKVYRNKNGLNLKWNSHDLVNWRNMAGLLLSVNIDCHQTIKNNHYSSCLLFQVTGEAAGDTVLQKPEPLPYNFTCPTPSSTTTTMTTNTSSLTTTTTTTNTSSSTTIMTKTINISQLPTTINTTTTTTGNTTIGVGGGNNGKNTGKSSGNIVSITAGVLTVLVVLAAIVIFVIILRKRRANEKENDNTAAILLPEQRPRPPVKRNAYEDQRVIYEKPTDSCKIPEYYDEKQCLYVSVDDEPSNYTSIEDEHHYETTGKAMNGGGIRTSNDKGKMSQRPLPDRPTEVNNPYYESSVLDIEPKPIERSAENDQLYSIYSSIDNLKGK